MRHKNICKPVNHGLTREQLDEFEALCDDLGLVPKSAIPTKLWPFYYNYLREFMNNQEDFDILTNISLNVALRNRKKLPKQEQEENLFLCV